MLFQRSWIGLWSFYYSNVMKASFGISIIHFQYFSREFDSITISHSFVLLDSLFSILMPRIEQSREFQIQNLSKLNNCFMNKNNNTWNELSIVPGRETLILLCKVMEEHGNLRISNITQSKSSLTFAESTLPKSWKPELRIDW